MTNELDARLPDTGSSLPLDDTIPEQSISYDFGENNIGIQASLSSAQTKPMTNLIGYDTDPQKFIIDDEDIGSVQQPSALELLKSTLADVASKANDAMNRVTSVSSEIGSMRSDANQAKSTANVALAKALKAISVAEQARNIARKKTSSVEDSDAETPSYVTGGGPQ